MKKQFQTLIGLASLIFPISARTQENAKDMQQTFSADDLQTLKTIIQYRQLELGNTTNEVTIYDIKKLEEINIYLSGHAHSQIAESTEFQTEVLRNLEISKYLDLQKGAYENQSMSFSIGN